MNIEGHDDTQHLIASARRVLEDVFPRDDEVALRELVTEDFVNHEAPPGAPSGPDSVIH